MIPGTTLSYLRSQVDGLKATVQSARNNLGDVDLSLVPVAARAVVNEAIGLAGTKNASALCAIVDQAAATYERSNRSLWLAGVNPTDNLLRIFSPSERGDAALQHTELVSAKLVLSKQTNEQFASAFGAWVMLRA